LETPDANREAEFHFDRSIELDPLFASAYAWKACTLGQAWGREFRSRTPELFQQMIQLVERATGIDENDTECHRIMCRIANRRIPKPWGTTREFVKGIVGSATVWPPTTQIHTVLFNLTMFVVLAMTHCVA
jgi:hypothetical protein